MTEPACMEDQIQARNAAEVLADPLNGFINELGEHYYRKACLLARTEPERIHRRAAVAMLRKFKQIAGHRR